MIFFNIIVFVVEINYYCMIFDFYIDGDYYFIVMKFVIKNFNVVYYMFLYGCDDNGNIYIFIFRMLIWLYMLGCYGY